MENLPQDHREKEFQRLMELVYRDSCASMGSPFGHLIDEWWDHLPRTDRDWALGRVEREILKRGSDAPLAWLCSCYEKVNPDRAAGFGKQQAAHFVPENDINAELAMLRMWALRYDSALELYLIHRINEFCDLLEAADKSGAETCIFCRGHKVHYEQLISTHLLSYLGLLAENFFSAGIQFLERFRRLETTRYAHERDLVLFRFLLEFHKRPLTQENWDEVEGQIKRIGEGYIKRLQYLVRRYSPQNLKDPLRGFILGLHSKAG